jgi:3-dehydroquinate synthase
MFEVLRQQFEVPYRCDVHFTHNALAPGNLILRDAIAGGEAYKPTRVLVVVDSGVAQTHPQLLDEVQRYAKAHSDALDLAGETIVMPGGERVKNDRRWLDETLREIDARHICRQSCVIAIGGGALLDMVGFAAATSHRGVRHIRMPSTTLAQADSGVGVKNGVNAFGKKNFLGSFAPPTAVINDAALLNTLDDRDWRSGIAEAIKVALLKDESFFEWIEANLSPLNARDLPTMERLIYRSAQLHCEHITSTGDPFERGASRPLDFGHWAAHKLEQLTSFELRHGEAVAVGLALDLTYSKLSGLLGGADCHRAIGALEAVGFEVFSDRMIDHSGEGACSELLDGLEEFREHLGGELTIMLLQKIGLGVEVHTMDRALIGRAVQELASRAGVKNGAKTQ